MATLDDVNTVKTVFLNGESLIRRDYMRSGEIESYGVRFRLFGSKRIEAIELMYESQDPPSTDLKDAVEIIAGHMTVPFAKHLDVYFDLDEERFLLNLVMKKMNHDKRLPEWTDSSL